MIALVVMIPFLRTCHEDAMRIMSVADSAAAVEAAALSSFAQVERCAGLKVSQWLAGRKLPAAAAGHWAGTTFARTAGRTIVRKRRAGTSTTIRYSITGKWFFRFNFTRVAASATTGEVPVGEAVWQYYDGIKME